MNNLIKHSLSAQEMQLSMSKQHEKGKLPAEKLLLFTNILDNRTSSVLIWEHRNRQYIRTLLTWKFCSQASENLTEWLFEEPDCQNAKWCPRDL